MLCKAKATCNSPPEIFPSCVRSGYKYFVMARYKCHNQVLSLQTESILGTNVTIEINAKTPPVGENKITKTRFARQTN